MTVADVVPAVLLDQFDRRQWNSSHVSHPYLHPAFFQMFGDWMKVDIEFVGAVLRAPDIFDVDGTLAGVRRDQILLPQRAQPAACPSQPPKLLAQRDAAFMLKGMTPL